VYIARKKCLVAQEILPVHLLSFGNLRTLYKTATGEIPPNRKALDYYWSVLFSSSELGSADNKMDGKFQLVNL
jgi:hypothetical protein